MHGRFARGRGWQQGEVPSAEDAPGWFAGRLPDGWFTGAPKVTVDRDEILIVGELPALERRVHGRRGAPPPPRRAGSAGSARRPARSGSRSRARPSTATAARSPGARRLGGTEELFTTLSVPVMTRLRQPERQVLDTLVDAGVARSRSEALAWAVRLVGEHADDWLADLRSAMEKVNDVRSQGPGPRLTALLRRRAGPAQRVERETRWRCSGTARPAPCVAWKNSWYPKTLGQGFGPLGGVEDRARRCTAAPPTSSSTTTRPPRRAAGPAARTPRPSRARCRSARPPSAARAATASSAPRRQRAGPHHASTIVPVVPGSASTANGVYVPAMNTKIIEWSARFIQRPGPRAHPGVPVIGGADRRTARES